MLINQKSSCKAKIRADSQCAQQQSIGAALVAEQATEQQQSFKTSKPIMMMSSQTWQLSHFRLPFQDK